MAKSELDPRSRHVKGINKKDVAVTIAVVAIGFGTIVGGFKLIGDWDNLQNTAANEDLEKTGGINLEKVEPNGYFISRRPSTTRKGISDKQILITAMEKISKEQPGCEFGSPTFMEERTGRIIFLTTHCK